MRSWLARLGTPMSAMFAESRSSRQIIVEKTVCLPLTHMANSRSKVVLTNVPERKLGTGHGPVLRTGLVLSLLHAATRWHLCPGPNMPPCPVCPTEQLQQKDQQILLLLEEKEVIFRDLTECSTPLPEDCSSAHSPRALFRSSTQEALRGGPLMKSAISEGKWCSAHPVRAAALSRVQEPGSSRHFDGFQILELRPPMGPVGAPPHEPPGCWCHPR